MSETGGTSTGWINFPPEKQKIFFSPQKKGTVLLLAGFSQMLLMLHRTFKYQRMISFFVRVKGGRGKVRCVKLTDCEGEKSKEKKNRQEGDQRMSVRTMPVDNKKCDSGSRRLKPDWVRNTFCF